MRGIEKIGVESARKNLQFLRRESAIDPALPILLRVHENRIELAVEPMHVAPGKAFEKTVLGQDADVLRKIGVINAARLQVQHLRREQPAETDRSRRADDDLGELFALDVIEDLQNGREAQLLQLVFRQFEFADRPEILDRNVVDLQVACGK